MKLSRKKEKGILALITAPSIVEAAKIAGVAEPTMHRWLRDPEFKASYQSARRELASQAIGQIQNSMAAAVKALKEIVENKKAPPSARVSAAKEILATGIKAIELEDLERRIAQIEQWIEREDK